MLEEIQQQMSSPRSWRCFFGAGSAAISNAVFSTLVEVFLSPSLPFLSSPSLLHARGGVSNQKLGEFKADTSSPRSWRCFLDTLKEIATALVFSTLVEVFLNIHFAQHTACSLLHARGGVSSSIVNPLYGNWSSPRSWRCFRAFSLLI